MSAAGICLARAPLEVIPLFIKAGSILPLAPLRLSVGSPGTLNHAYLHVWPRDEGHLDWYDDDGESLAHEHGAWHRRRITHRARNRGGQLRFEAATGEFPVPRARGEWCCRGITRPPRITVDRRAIDAEFDAESGLAVFDVRNRNQELVVEWK